mmetsp:Transcript_32253/g.53319  ORF Transcript_32253/g.53319 Transcript_32253/m.53319 type:complete len:148 (-) Transcript_32253:136-579(-)|eukprot:CAMPEP_0119014100 /NCGR_PEP_ID=MMETSP1176-20130426/9353_1 /TAXON_ID=265551 /ORGANISM="Synedropsis recta cf, Strain CCMP1620" /LENGTH=147 /DNA_ID=CAMNT_0006967239 /DNA_START=241 /DNA_END=684 /DNA_ORIENTATION=-
MSSKTSPNGNRRKSMEDELRELKEKFKKRLDERLDDNNNSKKTDTDDDLEEETTRMIVTIAVKAGLLCLGGVSLCFSSLFIPGVVPFLGGLLCGVSLIEPPPLPFDKKQRSLESDEEELGSRLGRQIGNDPSSVMKQVLLNFIDHFF